MARIGAFDRHLEPLAWWEAELLPAGWYVDELLVEPVAGGVTGTLTATLGSATLSATGTGPSTLSAILIPSSNNPSYRSGFYSPRRGGTPKYPGLWDGCVGAWAPSLGATGLTLRDESVFGNHGAITGASFVASAGKLALDFNGNNVAIPQVPNFGSNDVTFSAWIFYRVTNTETPIFARWAGQFANREFYIHITGNVLRFDIPWITICVQGITTINTGWSHVAVTRKNLTYTTYVNGKYDNQTYTANAPEVGPNDVSLGFSPGNSVSLNGQLDDLRIYNRALDQKDIATLATRRGIAFERASRKLAVSSAPAPTGSVSSTLANATLSSSGTLASGLTGSVSAVLADVSLSATSTLAAGASGTVTRTLDAATLASTGTVGSGVTATVSVTLAAATLSASSTLAAGLTGSTNTTLANATLSSSGTVAAGASGTVTRTLDNATLSATGGAAGSVTGSVSSTLEAVTCSSSATLTAGLSGSVTRTLADVTSSATGTVSNGASGSVTRTLANATLSSTGSFSAGLTAQVNRALDSCVVSSSGTVANGATGSLSVQLASATLVSGNVALGGFRLNVAGEWKNANAFVKVTGTWKNATPFVKVSGIWK
jgi:hypothetical protein